MSRHSVVVAGGGPTGMMLASELALAGVTPLVIERRPTQALAGSRAGGLQSRTIEILDMRGVAERFLAAGQVAQVAGFAALRLDIGDFPTRHPYGLALWQNHIERLLADWTRELGVVVRYGTEIVGLTEERDGVAIALADGSALHADYVVGCDGGRSRVRKAAGIAFPGWDATTSNLIAEVETTEQPPLGMRQDPRGSYGLGRVAYEIRDGQVVFADHGTVRVMIPEDRVSTAEPTLQDVRAGLIAFYGTDFGVHSPTWISRFTDAARQAAAYRKGRVLLAGDAAHVHSPVGGQGLNTGVQDAFNLGWKLAQVVKGTSPDALLDTYHAERHPVGARVLRTTMAQSALLRTDERTTALREAMSELAAMDEPRRRLGARMSGLDIRYELGDGHPLLGLRMPDLEVDAGAGARRVYTLLHAARPLLLNLGVQGSLDASRWADRVDTIHARHSGDWELPAIGSVTPPAAVLIRPDGYVAWVGDGTGAGLDEALAQWFGAPMPV